MKKATIATLALVLVLAASTFASAANYIGGGIGIIPSDPAGDTLVGKLPAFTFALDYDVMDKLSISANGYVKVVEELDAVSVTPTPAAKYGANYLVGGYVKYALANLDALKLGAVVGANYDSKLLDADADADFNYGAGVFVEQPLGDTGTIFGQAMYWVKPTGANPVVKEHIGGLGGINFRITDKIAVKGQVEYLKQKALFSIGVGYAF